MAGKNQYQEHPFKIVILVMKSILCAGWSICKRVHFPVFSVSESCWLPDSPPRSSAIQQTGAHSPAFLLPYSVPLQQPHGVLALGVEAVLLLPPHPCPQCHTARQGDKPQGHETIPLFHSVPQQARALRVRVSQLCVLWQVF